MMKAEIVVMTYGVTCVDDLQCSVIVFFFFFFKQKTAYEMLRSLVGSEMCIRDRDNTVIVFRIFKCSA